MTRRNLLNDAVVYDGGEGVDGHLPDENLQFLSTRDRAEGEQLAGGLRLAVR